MDVILPSLNENIPLEETLQIIDEAIERQQRAIDEFPLLVLKSRRNASVPVSRLPPEILCEIFSFAQVPELDFIGCKMAPLEWINLTYVCRHWRNIAINSPSLWTEPPTEIPQWVGEMLRRSKESNLVIKADFVKTDSGVALALEHIHRIRELSLRHIDSYTWNVLEEMLLSAPRLERFCLIGQRINISFGTGGGHQSSHLSISENILREAGPLRRLELEYCALNWNSHYSHLFCSLTHLKLHQLALESSPTINEFLDVLKEIPDLEVLDLDFALPCPVYPEELQLTQGFEDIHLARLRTLYINGHISPQIETFFRYITFPPTVVVRISCQWPDDEEIDANSSETILGLARSYLNPSPEAVFQSLVLQRTGHREYDTGVRIKLFTEALENFEMVNCVTATPCLELALYCAMGPQDITQLMSDVFTSGMHLDDITRIYFLEKVPELTPETIANTLGKLPQVHSVAAADYAARSFFNAMHLGWHGLNVSGSAENTVPALYFPSVSSIYLHEAPFGANPISAYPEDSNKLTAELLQDFLMQRSDLGAPIDTLFLHHCLGDTEEDVKLLKEIVVDVIRTVSTMDGGDEFEDYEDEYSDSEDENSEDEADGVEERGDEEDEEDEDSDT